MLQFIKVKDVKSPEKGTDSAAGFDFFIPNDLYDIASISPNGSVKIPSGIKMILPPGYCLLMVNKSGIALKGLIVGACLVDEDYRGEVHLHVINTTNEWIKLESGQKLVQGMLLPVPNMPALEITKEEFSKSENTERGSGGFGSTGLT